MTPVGCDLHSRKQQVAVFDTITGEVLERELLHDGDTVERFYRALRSPVTIGIETTGYTQWFHTAMHRLGHTVLVGEAAKIRAMVTRNPGWVAIGSPVYPLAFSCPFTASAI